MGALTYIKAWLVQRLLPSTGELAWVITSRPQKQVTIFGQAVEGANYSSFTPGQTAKTSSKIHTIFLNSCTDEMAKQYKAHAKGNVFYMGVSEDTDEPCAIITPDEYNTLIDDVDFDEVQPNAQ
jgi:hypothetical protein